MCRRVLLTTGLLTFYLTAKYPARVARLIVLDAAMSNATPATRAP